MEDNYSRFSRVAENYKRYRPHYPPQVLKILQAECGFTPTQVVADIGCGTGLLTELFIQNGNPVYGVEPNAEMRSACEYAMRDYPQFKSIPATAEATTLPDHSIDMITVGQAFHWFQHDLCRAEFGRILTPQGWVMLVWNMTRNYGSPFAGDYARFWQEYIDPRPWDVERPEYVTRFFRDGHLDEKTLDNYQVCDFDALKGLVLSASRSPSPDDPRYPAMLNDLKVLFDQYQTEGKVTLGHDTRVVYGQLF